MAAAGAPMASTDISESELSLEDVLAIILDSEAVSLDLEALKALRLTSKSLQRITNPYLCKVNIESADIEAFSRSALPPHITAINLVMSGNAASINSKCISQFCQINLPNLEKLTDKIDLGSLPLLARHGKKWSKLKDFSATITKMDAQFDNDTHLADFQSTQWPLESLTVRFNKLTNPAYTATATLLSAFPQLKSLTLDPISGPLVKALVSMDLPNLENLWLAVPRQWQPAGGGAHEVVKIISKQGNWPNLQKFSLLRVGFTPADASLLAGASLLSKMGSLRLNSYELSRDQARMIFRGLHGGRVRSLRILLNPEFLINLRGIYMPMLKTLELDLMSNEGVEQEVVDEAFDALFNASMPKLEKLSIDQFQILAEYMWTTPPAVNESANIFPSLKYLTVFAHITAAPACVQFLSRHLISGVEQLDVTDMHYMDLTDPLGDLLKDVQAAPKLSSLSMFTLGHGIKALPSHIGNLPELKLILVKERKGWESVWMVKLKGQLIQQPIKFGFILEASSALELADVAEYFDVELVRYPAQSVTEEQKIAKSALYEAFPEAAVDDYYNDEEDGDDEDDEEWEDGEEY